MIMPPSAACHRLIEKYHDFDRYTERSTDNFRGNPTVHIPRVFWETTTSRVLTLERIRGAKINDVPGLRARGIDPKALAKRAAEVLLEMVFENGFYHADPHPGNFFIESDGRIGLIDFGMVGTVDERTQEQLTGLLLAITNEDSERLLDALLDLGVTEHRVERDLLERDLDHLLSRYYGKALGEIAIGPLLGEVFAIMQQPLAPSATKPRVVAKDDCDE